MSIEAETACARCTYDVTVGRDVRLVDGEWVCTDCLPADRGPAPNAG